jgi:hypothetical protein
MTARLPSAIVRAFRRWALPLGCYYAVTLAVPLANCAAQAGSAFAGHALAVLVLPPLLIATACTIAIASRALRLWLAAPRQAGDLPNDIAARLPP